MKNVSSRSGVRLSVKSKVTLIATALFLLSLAVVSSIQLHYVKTEMMRLLSEQQHGFVAQVANDIDQKLATNLQAIAAAASVLPPGLLGDSQALERWTEDRVALRSLFSDIFIYSIKGNVLIDVPARGRRGIDVSDQENFQTTLAGRKPYISKPFIGKALKQPVISMSAPVLDRQGNVIGILSGSINLLQHNFLGNLNDARLGKDGSFSLMTRDRLIVTSRNKDRIMTLGPPEGVSPYFDHAVAGLEGSEEATNSRGVHALYSYSQLEKVPWFLAADLPIEEALAPVQQAQRRILEATLLIALLVAPLIWYVVRRFYDPLKALLHEREAGLHHAQSLAQLGHVVTGAEGKFESWSDTMPHLIGVPPERMPKSTREWLEILHPDDRARFRQTSIEADKNQQRQDVEYRVQRGDRGWIQLRQVMEPLKDATKQPADKTRWFNTLQDVTEQKQAEQILRESDRRFRDMLGTVKLVSLMLDNEARITYCNDYLLRLTGWQREEVLGRNWFELFIPPGIDDMRAVFAQLIANSPEAWHHENEILTRSGARRVIRWNNTVLRSGDGDVVGTASIGDDITEQRVAAIKITRLNRVYAVLSGINALIVRAQERNELFRDACRIAVEEGEFFKAWIGEVDAESQAVTVVAGESADVLSTTEIVAQAVKERRPVISNGSGATVVLPLIVGDRVDGVLVLHADAPGFFDEQEMRLLLELAGDIAFALDHIEKAKRLDYLAYYDALTGLANRCLFIERLEQQLTAARGAQSKQAVFILDIERFKTINDAYGHQAGDALLRQVADRLVQGGGDASRFARIGADHFAIFAADVENEEQLGRYVEQRLSACFGPPYQIAGHEVRISAKVGVAMFPSDGADAETLNRNAEAALKKAKAGGDRYLFYAQKMNERVAENLTLENKLRQAIEKEEFVLHYQPKVDLQTREIVAVEALIRWQSPDLGLVPPLRFIPLLEETGLILQVGAWALKRAALDHRGWVERKLEAPRIAVNVSQIQLRQRDFVRVVQRAIIHGVPRTGIDLELTESLIMEDVQGNIEKLNALRALGISIAIDDFGTGYSSLAYLARLPVEMLKIDRAFISKMTDEANAATLVQTIIALAHSMGLKVVAEGVETEEQAKLLRLFRCDQMQGFLFSMPLPLVQMTALLQARAVGQVAAAVPTNLIQTLALA